MKESRSTLFTTPGTDGGHSAASSALWDVAKVPHRAFVEGQWQDADTSFEVHDRSDARFLGRIPASTAGDVQRAIAFVKRHLEAQVWPTRSRREAMERAARLVGERSEVFATTIAAESSKPTVEARLEVQRCVETLRLSAHILEELTGQVTATKESPTVGRNALHGRMPVGIVAAITSFGNPLNDVARKLGPALVSGNGVVLMPSPHTPLSGLALVQVLIEAGVPAGRLAAVAPGTDVLPALLSHRLVDLVHFTGDRGTAHKVAAAAGAKRVLSESKGNNALIVCRDADAAAAATAIVSGGILATGHDRIPLQRAYVHISLFEQVLSDVIAHTTAVMASSYGRSAAVGLLGSEREASRVESLVREAVEEGARLQIGGARSGAFFQPAILTDVPSRCRIIREEVIAPVVSILPFIQVQDAVYEARRPENSKISMFTKARDSLGFERLDGSCSERGELRDAVRQMTRPKNTSRKVALPGSQHE